MQIHFIGKAKQFVGDGHMLGKVSAQTAHTFSHTLVSLLKICPAHGDIKTAQTHTVLQKHTHKLRYPHTVNTPGTPFIICGYAAVTSLGANTTLVL